ncbi:MAG: hypothetical protein IH897_13965, partial [Planctomycetes bacterium]|nr:hypothetical protein [Planctomycetota bacterium]
MRAARLLFLQGRHDEADGFFELARRLKHVEPESTDFATYDLSRDPLVVEPVSGSPADLRLEADDGAEICRALRTVPSTLNPLKARTYEDFVVAELLFDPLVHIDYQGHYQINPTVVEQINVSDEELITTLTLRSEARWHDGEPITAADVVFSWGQLPESDSSRAALSMVVALDERRIAFHHNERAAEPKWDLVFPIVPKHVFDVLRTKHPDQNHLSSLFSADPVGNGPYRFVDADEDRVILQRWEDYSGSRPHMKRVVFKIYEDGHDRIRALADGDVHEVELSPAEFVWDVNGTAFIGKIAKIYADRWSYDYICWNNDANKTPFFGDSRVRRAMTMAMNLGEIPERRYGIRYGTSTGIYHPSSWMASSNFKPLEYDSSTAQDLLKQAGWLRGSDGVRSKGGRRFDFSLLVHEASKETRLLLSEIVYELQAIGVNMQLEVASHAEFWTRIRAHDFDAFVYSVIDARHPDASRRRWIT